MIALDTNILIYGETLGAGPQDAIKHQIIMQLLDRLEELPGISTQSLAELAHVLVRKFKYSRPESEMRVRRWFELAEVYSISRDGFEAALAVSTQHNIPIFDAVILVSAAEARCAILLSEDFQDGFVWRGVTVCSPFAEQPDPRLAALLR